MSFQVQAQDMQEMSKLVIQVPLPEQSLSKLYSFKWLPWEKFLAFAAVSLFGLQQVLFGYQSSQISYQNQREGLPPIDGVSEGLFGFLKDNSDGQWRAFSKNIDLLVICAVTHLLLSKWVKSCQINIRFENQPLYWFNVLFGSLFALFLFRGGAIFWLFFTIINYTITKVGYNWKIFPLIIWSINIIIIFMNEFNYGYSLKDMFPGNYVAQWIESTRNDAPVAWHHSFNMTLLRIISFSMDKYWSYFNKRQQSDNDHRKKCKICTKFITCLRLRYDDSHSIEHYNLLNYYAYLLYTPLFITGPPLVFNAWLSQMIMPQNTHNRKQKINYTLRAVLNFVGFEVWIHISHAFAMSTRASNHVYWEMFSSSDMLLLGFTTLVFIWFKFNTIWKIARCWALWDDVEAPENMNRCICNNYNFEGFWRSWHRGFNQWLVRYIFIPLGGSKNKVWNIWVVFTFVAIWHDINWNLLLWAWGICLCMMPEVFVKNYFKQEKYKPLWKQIWWKYLCCCVGALWIYFMCITNLIGFGMGYKILEAMGEKLTNISGFLSLTYGFVTLLLTNLCQYYLRELEDDDDKGF